MLTSRQATALAMHHLLQCADPLRPQGSNEPSNGILTLSYAENPFCEGECISD